MGPENLRSRPFMQDRARRAEVGRHAALLTDFDCSIAGPVVRNDPDSAYIVVRDRRVPSRQLAVTIDCIQAFRFITKPDRS